MGPFSSSDILLLACLLILMPVKETGFLNPRDNTNGVIQHILGPKASFFEYVVADPVRNKEFADVMECHSKWNMTAWTDLFPTDNLLKNAKPDRPLVVDIGGSKGHDLEKFRRKHPKIPDGCLVLEELPGVLRDVPKVSKSILKLPYDFFTPQPVRGARAYLLHKVLHDWPDESARKILRNVVDAMEKGYSRLLIHENIIGHIKPSLRTTTSDLTMLACVTAAERTLYEWLELLGTVGLKAVKIWKQTASDEAVIEAKLV